MLRVRSCIAEPGRLPQRSGSQDHDDHHGTLDGGSRVRIVSGWGHTPRLGRENAVIGATTTLA